MDDFGDVAEIEQLRNAIALLSEDQWSAKYNTKCHCHPEWNPCCPQCEAPKSDGKHEPRTRIQ